jgi:HK97 family phage major capsid protein
MEAFIRNRLAQRIGRITNQHFTTGTGTGQPRGVVTAASLGKAGQTGQTTTVIFDDLVDLVHSVDPAYREGGRCMFMMNDASLKVVRKLKDSQGRPIFLPGWDGLAGPMPDTLLGYPVQVNQDVAVMAANAKSILFGDFTYYKIRDVMEVTLFRFDDSAYIKLGQIGFLAWMRSGGNFVDVGGAVKYYQNSAT